MDSDTSEKKEIKMYEWEAGAAGYSKNVVLHPDQTGFHITINKWLEPTEKIATVIKDFPKKSIAISWFDRFVKMLEE